MKLDMTARYEVQGWPGVAVWIDGWEKRWEPYTALVQDPDTGEEWEEETFEGEWVDDVGGMLRVVMVGDDHRHLVDPDDLAPLNREDYCGECGQVGCAHDGIERSDG